MIEQRHQTNQHGDPVLTITLTGVDDVYRFAHHLTRGQCEFAAAGRKTLAYLKRKGGAAWFARLQDRFHGKGWNCW